MTISPHDTVHFPMMHLANFTLIIMEDVKSFELIVSFGRPLIIAKFYHRTLQIEHIAAVNTLGTKKVEIVSPWFVAEKSASLITQCEIIKLKIH